MADDSSSEDDIPISNQLKKRKKSDDSSMDDGSDVVFDYTWRYQTVPKDVVNVHIHPRVSDIELKAFQDCQDLREVALNESIYLCMCNKIC